MLINGFGGGLGGLNSLGGGITGGVLPVGSLGGLGLGGGLIGRRRRSVPSNENERTNHFQHRFRTALQKFGMY